MKFITQAEVELMYRKWERENPYTGNGWIGRWARSIAKRKEIRAQLERDGYRIVV